MKLIVRDDIREGQILRNDATVVFGRMVEHKGWYILFNLHFIQKNLDDYVDIETWTRRPARCYYRTQFKLRYRATDKRWIFHRSAAWAEVL